MMKFKLNIVMVAILLSACGGGSGNSTIADASQTSPAPDSSSGEANSGGNSVGAWWTQFFGSFPIADEDDALEMNQELATLTDEEVATMTQRGAEAVAARVDGVVQPMPGLLAIPDRSRKAGASWKTKADTPAASADAATYGYWGPTFETGIVAIHASLMPGGELMLFGTDFAENPELDRHAMKFVTLRPGEAFVKYDNLAFTDNAFCAATLQMPDGSLVIAGGTNKVKTDAADKGFFGSDLLMRYTSPQADAAATLNSFGSLKRPRWYPSITQLPNGKILLVGGKDGNGNPVFIPELLDPTNGATTLLGKLDAKPVGWTYPRLLPYSDDSVIAVSGAGKSYLLNTTSQSITALEKKDEKIQGLPTGPVVMLGPDQALVAGSYSKNLATATTKMVTIDRSAAQPKLVANDAGTLVHARSYAELTLLADGSVLATGGLAVNDEKKPWQAGQAVKSAERWVNGSWTEMASEERVRGYHSTALLLPNGAVIKMGSDRPASATNYHGQIYYPPYLYNADGSVRTRAEIESAAIAGAGRGTLTVTLKDGTDISALKLVRVGSTTHQQNFGQFLVNLEFASSLDASTQKRVLTATVPASNRTMPPGYYMIFPIDSTGAPVQVATILKF